MSSDETPPDYESFGIELTAEDKEKLTILIVEPDEGDAEELQQIMRSSGYKSVRHVSDHAAAQRLLEDRSFSHVIFTARQTNIPVDAFVRRFLEDKPDAVLIPSSYEPSMDNVFDLLRAGCRGFLVMPPSSLDVDAALALATKGEALSKKILHAADRNQAFTALMSSTLDKVARAQRDAEKYEIARKELPMIIAHFQACVQLGKTFAEGGEDELQGKMLTYFERLSAGPASKIGRLRRRLQDRRSEGDS